MTSQSDIAILNPVTLPLEGSQLIEASAGTGKTFSITRIYLRALLEKALTVEQILVMTFSQAATEEIRGRIAETLHDAVNYWSARLNGAPEQDSDDPVFCTLFRHHSTHDSYKRLYAASISVDSAAIFTLHGFCQQMLRIYAFDTEFDASTTLDTDLSEVREQALRDWLRSIQHDSDTLMALAEYSWHTPEGFMQSFGAAFTRTMPIEMLDEVALLDDERAASQYVSMRFTDSFMQVDAHVEQHHQVLFEQLVTHKDAKKQMEREAEWQALKAWLRNGAAAVETAPPNDAVLRILHGRRYSKNDAVKALMEPLKALKSDVSDFIKKTQAQMQDRRDKQTALKAVYRGVQNINERIAEQKRRRQSMDFDDLIVDMANAVQANPSLADALAKRFPLAMVDEFQDTDEAQYQLLSHVYANREGAGLIMIGDPKQAIYGFRGGDIFTYLRAGSEAQQRWVMDVNWRSTAAMVNAYNSLFEQCRFDFEIEYHPVNASASTKAVNTPLNDPIAESRGALQWVHWAENNVSADDANVDAPAQKRNKADLQYAQTRWLATEVQRLLSDCHLGDRPVSTHDIAVLVRTQSEAHLVKQALSQAGIASVYMSNQRSVYDTEQALDVLRVLQAIAQPQRVFGVKASTISPLLGLDNVKLQQLFVDEAEQAWEELYTLLDSLKREWLQRGVLSMLSRLINEYSRINGQSKQRALVNYLHLAELLQSKANTEGLQDPVRLTQWLAMYLLQFSAGDESSVERLESDDAAIQIITQHKSKGLEYPIVFVPFVSSYRDPTRQGNRKSDLLTFYASSTGSRILQLGDSHQGQQQVIRENHAEATRLLYVAVTRAVYRCYLMVSEFDKSERSPIGRAFDISGENHWQAALSRFAAQCDDVSVLTLNSLDANSDEPSGSTQQPGVDCPLSCPPSPKVTPSAWRIHSFSAMTAAVSSGETNTAEWQRQRSIEQDLIGVSAVDTTTIDTTAPDTQQTLPFPARFTFPKGAGPGNTLHDVLEHKDFSTSVWPEPSVNLLNATKDTVEPTEVLGWLDDVLRASIPLCGTVHTRLCDLPLEQTLREAEFYFPVNGQSLNAVVRHLYGEQTRYAISDAQLSGMMHGFIDLIIEVEGRFFILDYKSNYLGESISLYHSDALLEDVYSHHYDVQALIYLLALHRYLGVSLSDYDPMAHLGGAVYLYLRGMSESNQHGEGCVHIPIGLDRILALDKLLQSIEGQAQ